MDKTEQRLLKAKAAGEEAVRRFEAREAKRAANREQWANRPHPVRIRKGTMFSRTSAKRYHEWTG
jgi:hypothetical protein